MALPRPAGLLGLLGLAADRYDPREGSRGGGNEGPEAKLDDLRDEFGFECVHHEGYAREGNGASQGACAREGRAGECAGTAGAHVVSAVITVGVCQHLGQHILDILAPCPFLGIIVGCHGDRVDAPLVPPASAKQKTNVGQSPESGSSFSERVWGNGQHTQVGPEPT